MNLSRMIPPDAMRVVAGLGVVSCNISQFFLPPGRWPGPVSLSLSLSVASGGSSWAGMAQSSVGTPTDRTRRDDLR